MFDTIKKLVAVVLMGMVLLPLGQVAVAQEKDEKAAADVENKLLRLTSLEEAFVKAARRRNGLASLVVQENQKLQAEKDEAKKAELQRGLDEARKQLQALSVAMEMIFGIGNRRDYEYNTVTSTVYLKVGTVEEAFVRAVKVRDALRNYVVQQKPVSEAEKDEAKKKELEAQIAQATRQYQLMAASLQLVFQVVPDRNYEFNPANSTLYLKVSDNEVAKLKAKIEEMQQKAAAEQGK